VCSWLRRLPSHRWRLRSKAMVLRMTFVLWFAFVLRFAFALRLTLELL
jgi:hypothetical protein